MRVVSKEIITLSPVMLDKAFPSQPVGEQNLYTSLFFQTENRALNIEESFIIG